MIFTDLQSLLSYLLLGLFIALLLMASWIDARTFYLPDYLTYPLIGIGLLLNVLGTNTFTHLINSSLGVLLGFFLLYFVNKIYFLFRHENGIGMGDAKLLAGIGGLLGYQDVIPCLFIASVCGLFGGYLWLRFKKLNTSGPFPFGPYLAFAAIVLISLRLYGIEFNLFRYA